MNQKKTILIAGATGYSGRCLAKEFASRPEYTVKVLVRRVATFDDESIQIVMGEATKPDTLKGCMDGVDMVVSALGITRQRDGLTYHDVDYQANMNLLKEAESAGVSHFGYIHVIHGDILADLSVGVAAKQAFVDQLVGSSPSIRATVMCPSGFFSDMQDFLDMAKSGRVYLFGGGNYRLNPIHGADLAKATADAMSAPPPAKSYEILPVGGPDIYTHTELATMALEVMGKPVRVTYIWDVFRKMIQACLPWVTPISVYGPAQFFLSAFDMDMIGECKGTHHLKDFWLETLQTESDGNADKK